MNKKLTNIKFISVRKFGGISWDVFRYDDGHYIAINHKFNKTFGSDDWDALWSRIMDISRDIRKQ